MNVDLRQDIQRECRSPAGHRTLMSVEMENEFFWQHCWNEKYDKTIRTNHIWCPEMSTDHIIYINRLRTYDW